MAISCSQRLVDMDEFKLGESSRRLGGHLWTALAGADSMKSDGFVLSYRNDDDAYYDQR